MSPNSQNETVMLRPAEPGDAPFLSALALRSKASWGYPEDFLRACVRELTVTSQQIEGDAHHHEVAMRAGKVVGFYTLEGQVGNVIELGALFVEPDHRGSGVGKQLLAAALVRAESLGACEMTIQGDPNADGFYRSAGAQREGSRESGSIPGRILPMYRMFTGHRPNR